MLNLYIVQPVENQRVMREGVRSYTRFILKFTPAGTLDFAGISSLTGSFGDKRVRHRLRMGTMKGVQGGTLNYPLITQKYPRKLRQPSYPLILSYSLLYYFSLFHGGSTGGKRQDKSGVRFDHRIREFARDKLRFSWIIRVYPLKMYPLKSLSRNRFFTP